METVAFVFLETLPCALHRWQQQHLPLKCKISSKSGANDSRLLGCETSVIGSVVTSVSKDHRAFIYKVRQSLNMKA